MTSEKQTCASVTNLLAGLCFAASSSRSCRGALRLLCRAPRLRQRAGQRVADVLVAQPLPVQLLAVRQRREAAPVQLPVAPAPAHARASARASRPKGVAPHTVRPVRQKLACVLVAAAAVEAQHACVFSRAVLWMRSSYMRGSYMHLRSAERGDGPHSEGRRRGGVEARAIPCGILGSASRPYRRAPQSEPPWRTGRASRRDGRVGGAGTKRPAAPAQQLGDRKSVRVMKTIISSVISSQFFFFTAIRSVH